MLSRVAPWLASHKDGAAPDGATVRVLGVADTRQLRELAETDPVANVFILAHLESTDSAAPTPGGANVLGVFDDDVLVGACWAGANLVPVQLDPGLAGPVAEAAHRSGAGTRRSSDRPALCWRCTAGWRSWATWPTRYGPTSRS